jgi:hypothetical protein
VIRVEVICPLVYIVGVVIAVAAQRAFGMGLGGQFGNALAGCMAAVLWPMCLVLFPVFFLLEWLWGKAFGET